jgi:SAM-dependent methyltransferase
MLEIRHPGMDDTSATQNGYNQIFHGEGLHQMDSFYLWLVSLLHASQGSRLLDISCGEGRLVVFARRQRLNAAGTDFAKSAINKARAQDTHADWFIGDGERLPLPPACYDYITHIGSLEHYQDPMAGIREISRVLKPGGVACILLPNSFGLLGNIIHVFKKGDIFDDGQPLQRYNTRMGWQKMLETNRLRPFKILKYELPWPRTIPDLWWYVRRPIKIIRLVFSFLVPLNFGNSLVYLCRRDL